MVSGISKKEVTYVAKLSRIHLAEEEIEKLTTDLDGILHWMECLDTIQIPKDMEKFIPEDVVMTRSDYSPQKDLSQDLMRNAPDHDHNFFAVPKVID